MEVGHPVRYADDVIHITWLCSLHNRRAQVIQDSRLNTTT